ncbi:MAG: hypothetical protein JNM18_14695 [Planctomycetaceae bacterium]|nr:hypothetical protein [Planctomycetaceae bacterium]
MVQRLLSITLGGCLLLIAVGAFELPGYAQEAEKTTSKKERDKAKGYLPPFYRDVIDGVQKEKIYQLQSEYDVKIDALTAQIKQLRDERDAAINSLLTPEQKKRLGELNDAARSKKAADIKAKLSTKSSDASQ